MLGKFVIAGFEVIIGLIFVMYALGPFYTSLKLMPAGSEALAIVVFFVGVASFAGIPVIITKPAKGIKLFLTISVIQIGSIISCWIFKAPGMGGPSLGERSIGLGETGGLQVILGLPLAVLFILVIASRRL